MGEVDWEKRARELVREYRDAAVGAPPPYMPQDSAKWVSDAALQLGREMVADATERMMRAGMAREIAARKEAADARAEEIANRIEALRCSRPAKLEDATDSGIGFIRASEECLAIARSFISKPKTREDVLEEALKEIADSTSKDNIYGDQKRLTAKRALEWRPDK